MIKAMKEEEWKRVREKGERARQRAVSYTHLMSFKKASHFSRFFMTCSFLLRLPSRVRPKFFPKIAYGIS